MSMNNSATQKKTQKKPLAPVEITITDNMDGPESELCKKIRNLRKKLRQIDELKESKAKGEMNDEQKSKIGGRKAMDDEINAVEQQLRDYRSTKAGEIKKAKQMEQERSKELRQCREGTLAMVADLLLVNNLRQDGAQFDQGLAGAVAVCGNALDALRSGDGTRDSQREEFTRVWSRYTNSSNDKVHGDMTFGQLRDAVSALMVSGNLPTASASA